MLLLLESQFKENSNTILISIIFAMINTILFINIKKSYKELYC